MQDSAETKTKRIHATDENEDPARKRPRTDIVGQFPSLPVEIIQIVLDHLVTSISPKERIHFHKNHQDYNRYLAELGNLVRVNKLFNKLLTPYMYREIRLPREFGYASSREHKHQSKLAREDDPQLQDPHTTTDSSAAALARLLKTHPEKAALVKKIHIDPVARTQGRDADDCDAYTTILQQCKGTIEELAIAINCSNGDMPFFDVSDSQHQALIRFSRTRMPQLKHLILKYEELRHLDLIEWNHLDNLQAVTVLTGYHVSPAHVDSDDNHVFQVLMRLPSTVRKLTFGSVFAFEWFNPSDTLHGDISDADDITTFADILASALKEARSCGKLGHLENFRLVWAYAPDNGERCDCCLVQDRSVCYTLPRLRRGTGLEDLCADELTEHVNVGNHKASFELGSSNVSGRKPLLQMYEVWCPPGYRAHWPEDVSTVVLTATAGKEWMKKRLRPLDAALVKPGAR
ncbi:hypothetical protein OC861_004638 [Tilletia horrida]|nr:hypothetical protein OC861_004638 [Tilletia horrida]